MRDGLAAFDAELGASRATAVRDRGSDGGRDGGYRLEGVGENLGHGGACSETHAHAGCAAGVGGGEVERFSCGIEGVAAQSPTIFMPMRWSKTFCSSSGREMFSTANWSSKRPRAAKAGFICADDLFGEDGLVGGHIEEGEVALGEDFAHAGDDGVAQLAFKIGGEVDVAGAADLGEEGARIGDAIGVDTVAAQADGAELLVASGDGRGRAPLLIDLRRVEKK